MSIKLDQIRLEQADSRQTLSTGPGAANQRDKDRFEEALAGKRDGEQGQSGDDPDRDRNNQDMPSAASLFGSLFEGRLGAASQIAGQAPIPGDLGDLVDDLVQRILVSDPKAGEQAEVRLQLGDGFLRNTEIMLHRTPDGMLHVNLLTNDAASYQALNSARHELADQLAKHGAVEVNLNNPDDADAEGNDTGKRSRGLFDSETENV